VSLALSGGAKRPWTYREEGACGDSSLGLMAGFNKGVDFESSVLITAPSGTTSMNYFYSNPSALDVDDDFHVLVNDVVVKSYETENEANCALDCIDLTGGDIVRFFCRSGGNGETCSIDRIRFYGSDGTRTFAASGDDSSHRTSLPTFRPSRPPIAESARRLNQISSAKFDFTASSKFTCKEATAGQSCPDTSTEKSNCCLNLREYDCGTCSSCDGYGQLLNGRDGVGRSCCEDSYLAENTFVKCLGDHGVFNYDMCCKTTTIIGQQRPQDFYCFVDKGSPEGNYAYCLGLADDPPEILGLKSTDDNQLDSQASPMLRASVRQQKSESTTHRMFVLFGVLLVSLLFLYVYKIMLARYI